MLRIFIFMLLSLSFCNAQIQTGAENISEYLPLLEGKNVGLVVNQTSRVRNRHLLDTLISLKADIKTIMSPEHGFRGDHDAGEIVSGGIDSKTGLPVISLYGKNKKPLPSQLENIDVIIFDIQDIGARFFTYISTMHYVLEAAAEHNKKVIILDRPNPIGNYVAGPILDTSKYRSFVGMHPIPIVHGLTVGELAQMIKGEEWIKKASDLDLTIIPCTNYTHNSSYSTPIKPSPNIPSDESIKLYPTLCLFEPTQMSIGRGTYRPFEVLGTPKQVDTSQTFKFKPISIDGMSKHPKHENLNCFGWDLKNRTDLYKFDLNYFTQIMHWHGADSFITRKPFFMLLLGSDDAYNAIINGSKFDNSSEIKSYKEMRSKYLLYQDFE